jgi:hypothetical protein
MASANPKTPWHWDARHATPEVYSTPLQSSELATRVFNVFSATFQKLQVSDSTIMKLLSYSYHHPVELHELTDKRNRSAIEGKKVQIVIIISKGERAEVGNKELDANPGVICGCWWPLD